MILTERKEWQALAEHHMTIANQHMRHWFAEDAERFNRYHLTAGEILLDYSRNRITEQTIALLSRLAESQGLADKIEALFAGHPINTTEKRPALHTALRDRLNALPCIQDTHQKLQQFVTQIHTAAWRGSTGKPIAHVVNIGIGGSYTGPMLTTHALKEFAVSNLQFHFISTVDHTHVQEVLQRIDPETTLFVISSKSLTTLETITNARAMLAWMQAKLGDHIQPHFVAVTAAKEKALALGIAEENIFPVWEWVGGRYSIWSAIGLPLALMIGWEQFQAFLTGAHEIDQHFRSSPFEKNMPVVLALLSVWYMNFFGAHVQAIVPYAHRLRYLIPYLQQAEMESNGKSRDIAGNPIHYATGPVIFGEEGCTGQHSFHQLLHQGQQLVPVDFILVGKGHTPNPHHAILLGSGLSQAQALMRGKTQEEAYQALLSANHSEENAALLAPHQAVPGNKPSNIIFLERITPKSLGALLALYEHKIFVQGVIWNINSFDQWGVELGKQLLPDILELMQGAAKSTDVATEGLIKYLRQGEGK